MSIRLGPVETALLPFGEGNKHDVRPEDCQSENVDILNAKRKCDSTQPSDAKRKCDSTQPSER